jgi:hypothetical protein
VTVQQLPIKLANQVSNALNRMLLGQEACARAIDRGNSNDTEYWHNYQLQAEKELQEMGVHLAAPLE